MELTVKHSKCRFLQTVAAVVIALKSLAAITIAESSAPQPTRAPRSAIASRFTAKPDAEILKGQTNKPFSKLTISQEDIKREEELTKVETSLFNWLQAQGLKPLIIAQIGRAHVTKWPRWGELLRTLTGANEKEELKRLLNARFSLSTSREQDLAISGLSTTILSTATPAPVGENVSTSVNESIKNEFNKASDDTLRIQAIADPLQRQFETAKAFPEFPLNWIVLADMLVERGRIKEARQYYEKAILVGPGTPAAWLGAAKTAEKLGDAKRAQECRVRYKELVNR